MTKPAPMIVVYPRGQLSANDKARMTKHGILCIEADDPKSVVTLIPSAPFVSPDDMLMAALAGLNCASSYSKAATFTAELERRLVEREKAGVKP